MAITGQPQAAGFPLTFPLPSGKLSKPSWVKISQVRTISVERVGQRMASLKEEDLDQVIDGLLELIR
jgi:mRNA interferase MazF